jgi:hypothetical protein
MKYHLLSRRLIDKTDLIDIGKRKMERTNTAELIRPSEPAPQPPPSGWTKHEEYVLRELQRLARAQERTIEKLTEFQIAICADVSSLRTKAGTWGAIAGIIGSTVIGAIVMLAIKMFVP